MKMEIDETIKSKINAYADIIVANLQENNYIVIESREEAIKYAIRNAIKDDTILLAGKGHENYFVDFKGKHSFDERNIIKNELSK